MVLKGYSLAASGANELRCIPKWSSQHFEATGKPLRFAVDSANWWCRNITAQKEAELRRQNPTSHPREKRIMDRILYLLRMNVQLLFVFSGSSGPSEAQPAGQEYTESNVALLKELLDHLGVPFHDAPGSAVAECARLQELGVVDAIWTDSTEVLMFGTDLSLVSFRKKEGEQFKGSKTVVVSPGKCIKERTGLSKEGFLMYGMLVGCDYTDGLEGFEKSEFSSIEKHAQFDATAKLLASPSTTSHELGKWRAMIARMLKDVSPTRELTGLSKSFPDIATLKHCARPIVSFDVTLLDLPCLRRGWFRSYCPGMLDRYRFLLHNFNSGVHESWVARDLVPIELTNRLREAKAEEIAVNKGYNIQAKRKLKDTPVTTVTVDPLKVIPELKNCFLKDVYRTTNGKKVEAQAPMFRLEEMDLLDCVMKVGLSEVELPAKPLPNIPRHSRKQSLYKEMKPSTPIKLPPAIPPKPAFTSNRTPRVWKTTGLHLEVPVSKNTLLQIPESPITPASPASPITPFTRSSSISSTTELYPLSPLSPYFQGELHLPGDFDWGLPSEPAWHSLPSDNPLSKTASKLAKRISLHKPVSPVMLEQFAATQNSTSPTTAKPQPVFEQPTWWIFE
ncbi:PIN domain-like protein [Xylariaceae sp. FL1272]|nr:PIN domain-like protein [Xylariaceae sp. FL1272]